VIGTAAGAEAAAGVVVMVVDAATDGAGVAGVVAAGVGEVPADEHAAVNIIAARAKPPRRLVPLINVVSPLFWAAIQANLLPVPRAWSNQRFNAVLAVR